MVKYFFYSTLLFLMVSVYALGSENTSFVTDNYDNYYSAVFNGDGYRGAAIDTSWQIPPNRKLELKINPRYKHFQVHTPEDKFYGHWGGIELGFNNLASSKFGTSLSDDHEYLHLNAQKSVTVGLNLFPCNINLKKRGNNFGLVTGLGLTIHNFRLDSQNILMRDENKRTTYEVTTREVKKNKLTATYLTIPLLLEYQFPASQQKRAYISAGVYGGLKLGSHTKVVYNDHLDNNKVKSRANLNMNTLKYGATLRVGYGMIQLFATADFAPMFQNNYGPEVYPWSVGIALITF